MFTLPDVFWLVINSDDDEMMHATEDAARKDFRYHLGFGKAARVFRIDMDADNSPGAIVEVTADFREGK